MQVKGLSRNVLHACDLGKLKIKTFIIIKINNLTSYNVRYVEKKSGRLTTHVVFSFTEV